MPFCLSRGPEKLFNHDFLLFDSQQRLLPLLVIKRDPEKMLIKDSLNVTDMSKQTGDAFSSELLPPLGAFSS